MDLKLFLRYILVFSVGFLLNNIICNVRFTHNNIRKDIKHTISYPVPYDDTYSLSIVVASSNDQYGGDSIGRLITMLTNTTASFPEAEVILVDWESNNGPLNKVIPKWLQDKIIIYRIPSSLSRDYKYFMEYISKNVGIRRATKEWILTVNQDNLFPISMSNYLKHATLSPDAFYRVDRFDFGKTIKKSKSTLNHCYFECDINTPVSFIDDFNDKCPEIHRRNSGDFILASKVAWLRVGGFLESHTNQNMDWRQLLAFKSFGYKEAFIARPCGIIHQNHIRARKGRYGSANGLMPIADIHNCVHNQTTINPLVDCIRHNNLDWGYLYNNDLLD